MPVAGARPRTVRISPGEPGYALVHLDGPRLGPRVRAGVTAVVRHILRLDEDLLPFYAIARGDPANWLWACGGAGRMIRSPTVFGDVIKTLCTTNCSWALTRHMVEAPGEATSRHRPRPARRGRAGADASFPGPEMMADASARVSTGDVVHAGYRVLLPACAERARPGWEPSTFEVLGCAGPAGLSDDDVAERLGALPGIGPYAVAHIMMLIGRYSRPTLDSWTRPTYARLRGRPLGCRPHDPPAVSPVRSLCGACVWLSRHAFLGERGSRAAARVARDLATRDPGKCHRVNWSAWCQRERARGSEHPAISA